MKTVDLIRAAGISQGRDECFWHVVEYEKGRLAIPPRVLENLEYSRKKGLETLLILNYAHPLYDDGMAPVSDEAVQAFARYCRFMARELKGSVCFFEIWNEPNADGFWRPHKNVKDYARLLKEAYRAVKEGNPDALVLGGSLAGLDEEFFQQMIELRCFGHMDAFSVHPYCHPKTPEDARIFEKMEDWRNRIHQAGMGWKDFWITEIGWPTNLGGGVSEREQAVRISRMYLNALRHPWIATTFIYWFGPDGKDPEWAEDRFGMIRQDFTPKPSHAAVATITRHLENAIPGAWIEEIPGIRILYFTGKQGEHIYALWSLNGYASCEGRTPYPALITSLDNNPCDLAPAGGAVFLRLGEMPILVSCQGAITWLPSGQFVLMEQEDRIHDEEVLMIPRGQSRAIKIQGSFNLNSWRTGFSTAHETGLEFAVLDDVPTITARKDSQSGLSHFALLLSPPDNPFPAMRIEASAHICDPLDIRVRPLPPRPDGSRHFLVTFRNNGLHPTSCHARLETGPDIRLSRSTITTPLLEPGRSFSEQIEILSHHDPDDLFHICVQSSLDDGVEVAHKELITFMESRKTGVSPDIDGDLSDWPRESRFIRFGSNLQIIGGYVPWNGPEDCSARLYTCWDDEWIYFGVEFQDDRLSSPCLGFTVYNNDGIELYFDTDHEGDWGEAIYSNDDHQYGLSLEQGRAVVYSWSQLKGESKDSRITLNTSPLTTQTISGRPFRGMIIEAAIPLDELGLAPHEGMQIGFSAAATDDDDPHTVHPFFQEVQFGWTRRKNQWQNPTTFGDLFFTDLGAWPGTPSSTFEALNDERDRLFFSWPTEGLKDISGDLFRKIKRQGFNTISLDWSSNQADEEINRENLAILDLARKYGFRAITAKGPKESRVTAMNCNFTSESLLSLRWSADCMRGGSHQNHFWLEAVNTGMSDDICSSETAMAQLCLAWSSGFRGFTFHECGAHQRDMLSSALNRMQHVNSKLAGFAPPEPEIGILQSETTQRLFPDSEYALSQATITAEMLYTLGFPFRVMTEDDLVSDATGSVRLLFVAGTMAASDELLAGIDRYIRRGGQIFACARYAEFDGEGNRRTESPSHTGISIRERLYYDRPGNTSNTSSQSSSPPTNHPMTWEPALFELFHKTGLSYGGEPFESGEFRGLRDIGENQEVIEFIEEEKRAVVLASFQPMRAAITTTPDCIYVARDLFLSGETMLHLIEAACLGSGALRFATIRQTGGKYDPEIMFTPLIRNSGKFALIAVNTNKSVKKSLLINVDRRGPFRDAFSGKTIEGKRADGTWLLSRDLPPLDVLILIQE